MNVVVFVIESSDRGDVVDVTCDIDFVKSAVVDVLLDIVLVAAPVIVGLGGKSVWLFHIWKVKRIVEH